MELSDPSFRLGATAVLAYPDDTRLGGYRAALALWTALARGAGGSDSGSGCTAEFGSAAVETLQPQGVAGVDVPEAGAGVPVVLARPPGRADLTFCFVSGLPAAAHVPALVDRLVGLFEAQGVERVVVPAAANVAGAGGDGDGDGDGDGLWALFPAAGGGQLQAALADVPRAAAAAQTTDAFLSAVATIAAVSAIGEVALLVHADRRPGTSGFRERVEFGAEFADDGDAAIVQALAQRLGAAVGAATPLLESYACGPVLTQQPGANASMPASAKGKEPAAAAPAAPGEMTPEERLYQETVRQLQKTYEKKIKPLEQAYSFEGFHSAPLTPQDIGSKPMVLLLGQYSTGKTTFVEYLLGEPYPGAHVGIEPTTDRFVAIMHGAENKVVPGHAAAVSGELPFSGLTRFGSKYLSRFQVAHMNNPLLENLTLVDTPGILAGSKQIQRGYDFISVINWFAERSDLILLLFDAHKLDISDEFKGAIQSLRGHEDKVRIVLNKCDQIGQQQLMRVYGALMWSLGKVIPTPEVNRVYLGSFWPRYKSPVGAVYSDNADLLASEQRDLLRDLRSIPKNAAVRRVNEIVKRARQARVHAHIIGYLRSELPSIFGKSKKAKAMLEDLPGEFRKIQAKYSLPPGDFPNPDAFKADLEAFKIADFNKFSQRLVANADEALSVDFPRLMQRFPANGTADLGFPASSDDSGGGGGDALHTPAPTLPRPAPTLPPYSALSAASSPSSRNPFSEGPEPSNPALLRHQVTFDGICDPHRRVLSSASARTVLADTGLPTETLRAVWDTADWDARGELDKVQFEVAMRLCERLRNKEPLDAATQSVMRELGLQSRLGP
ncbi:hypothetical protein H4R18_001557 [Coemansia javaensis]|uniref:Uncharacterized protein n=1 Tax=Coemansia javaensis TaxID=2761396 RepID=A0A9W8HCI8_9FUNG|nr:hypothetical protein H4R18_001557 [Coemansia javaensis]